MSQAIQLLLTLVLAICLGTAGWLLSGRPRGGVLASVRLRPPVSRRGCAAGAVRATAAVPLAHRLSYPLGEGGAGDPGPGAGSAPGEPGAGVPARSRPGLAPVRRNTSAAVRMARLGGYRSARPVGQAVPVRRA